MNLTSSDLSFCFTPVLPIPRIEWDILSHTEEKVGKVRFFMGDETQKSNPSPPPNWTPLTETGWFQRGMRLLRWGSFFALGCVAVLLLGLLVLKSQPLPIPEQPLTTRIYSADGTMIDELHSGERREYVPLEHLPPALIQATLAIEDRHFYDHIGISPRGMARSAWANLKARSIVEGASTITQQLARNLYLNQDRTWTRKLKEMKYALQLEIHYDKDDILEMYLNEIYFGHQAYGIGQAAEMYFGKKPRDLTIAEAALLAGIPKGAGIYSPYLHPDNAKARQRIVLQAMQKEGYLTSEEMQHIWKQPLTYKLRQQVETKAPYFRDYVKSQAIHRHGLTRDQVENGGLRIYTTLDLELQAHAEQAIKEHIDPDSGLQTALVAVDPDTGFIQAMVGGTDYERSEYNRTLAQRQPGSAFKPFLYLVALENGMTPATQMTSEPTTFTFGDDETYEPQNYRGQYEHGAITLRQALVRSDNIYAVKTHFLLGRDKLVDMAGKLGINQPLEPHPSLALGAVSVSPLEMTEAYTTIARQGEHIPLTAIKRIEDKDGEIVFEATPDSERVVSPAAAFVLTHMLQGVFDDDSGTGHIVRQLVSHPIAGKTGSTDGDSWLIGFSPNLVASVWVGYDRNQKLSPSETRIAKWVWGTFMQKSAQNKSPRVFKAPQGVTAAHIDPESGLLATDDCPGSYKEYFVKGTVPTATCPIHSSGRSGDRVPEKREDTQGGSWIQKLKDWWQRP